MRFPSLISTHLLSPWNRVLLEKLTGSQLFKKFPAFYGIRRLLSALQEPAICPCPKPDQSSPCPPFRFLKIQLNMILLSRPRSSKWSLYLRFLHQNSVYIPPLLHTLYMSRPSHSSRFDHPNNIWWGVQRIKLLIM